MARAPFEKYDTEDYNRRAWGGYDGGADADVERYRRMGEQQQAALQLDQGHADQSRGVQMGALGLLRNAAHGNAPSQAAAMGQLAAQNALRQGTASSGGSLAGMRSAMGQTAGQMGQASAGAMEMRAREAARDMGAFSGAASAIRGQDINAATTNAQLEAQQRALNEQRQQGYEKMGWDTRNADMNAALEAKQQDEQQAIKDRQHNAEKKQSAWDKAKDVVGMVAGPIMGLLSDERAKTNVAPMGSLARLFRR